MANTKKKKKKSILPVVFFILIFIAGLSLLLYPTISTLWNNVYQSYAMAEYAEIMAALTPEQIAEIRADATEWNELIYALARGEEVPEDLLKEYYERALNIDGKGMMGMLNIPKINVHLPIRHGTSEPVLQDGVGHIEGTSLPIGGPNTHCALSGHTGLPSARLLTDLDRLGVGDYFVLEVLNEELYYQVDQINVVLPNQSSYLQIVPNMDLCTLVTCTPYGVNSHRLLVRGLRVITDEPIPPEVLAAGNPDYVSVLEPFENDIPDEFKDDPNYRSGDLSGLTFNRNMPWWLRNVYTPIYIAIGAVLLLLAALIIPAMFRKRKKKKQQTEEQEAGENEEEGEKTQDEEKPENGAEKQEEAKNGEEKEEKP